MTGSTIDNLPVNTVFKLYEERLVAEQLNDIGARTLLREQYPDLFCDEIWQEIKQAYKFATVFTEKQMRSKAQIIKFSDIKKRTK